MGLAFQFNAMFMRKVENVVPNFGLHRYPLSRSVDIYNINTKGKVQKRKRKKSPKNQS